MKDQPVVHLADMDWPWKAENHAGSIILVSDEQFRNLAIHPDEAIEKPAPWFDHPVSLKEYCETLAESGATKIHIAYDYFFGGSQRGLYPDTPEFQELLKKIYDVARAYHLGIEPSVLSPLELGVGYRLKTGESGRWMQYAEGQRDPVSGKYSVMMWQHTQWVNNKGPTPVTLTGVRVFAFREDLVPGSIYFSVNPGEIHELAAPEMDIFPNIHPILYGAPDVGGDSSRQFQAHKVRIFGEGQVSPDAVALYDRVLVVLVYQTCEMDYFSDSAEVFLADLVGQYYDRGIELEGLYSDEMHIQQDWIYHHHFDHGQFTLRYVSPGFEKAFAKKFGQQFHDFAPWLVYFTCHQHHFLATHEPKLPSQHVFGPELEDIAATHLFRRNYYHFLEESVVALMTKGRQKLEELQGKPLDAFYHSTWAESPTCDLWAVDGVQRDWSYQEHRIKYEYTPDFVWSNTVQQAAAACANYFAWNEFLTGGNNDIPEGGYADRNYYGRALAASLAAVNRQPLPSCGMWGMPGPVAERMNAVSEAYGVGGHSIFRSVEEYTGRAIDVLFIYPQDLVAVEERFGSWMVQYGYANLITADKLVLYSQVMPGGQLKVRDSLYRAVCVLFEPFPSPELFQLFQSFLTTGGTVIWSGIPPRLFDDGARIMPDELERLFGCRVKPTGHWGRALPGRKVIFEKCLSSIAPMHVLTDFLVDRVYAIEPEIDAEPVAWISPGGDQPPMCVGTRKEFASGGQGLYLGFRPRDDQSASTGEPVRTWFEILNCLGCYPSSPATAGPDHPAVIAQRTEYVACQFPNGAMAIAPHFRHHEENWQGGFFRHEQQDLQAVNDYPVAGDEINLNNLAIAGEVVSYYGKHCLAWRKDSAGKLTAFAGLACSEITLDGIPYQWSDQPVDIAWHPLKPEQGIGPFVPMYRVWCGTPGVVRYPLGITSPENIEVWVGSLAPLHRPRRRQAHPQAIRTGYGSHQVPWLFEGGVLIIDIQEEIAEHWLYIVYRKPEN